MDFFFINLRQAAQDIDDKLAVNPQSTKHPEHYKTGVDCGFKKLEEYYNRTDVTPIYRAALMLHPSRKDDYFKQYWTDHEDWITRAIAATRQLFEEYVKAADHQAAEDAEEGGSSS